MTDANTMIRNSILLCACFMLILIFSCKQEKPVQNILADPDLEYPDYKPTGNEMILDRSVYEDKLHGFWLGQCIANWTGLITEMDKIGGDGVDGRGAGFYTREDWGGPDGPAIWEEEAPDQLIDFVLVGEAGVWGADDDTDIEYIYQHMLDTFNTSILTGTQIRQGWLNHVYSDQNTPFVNDNGDPENYLWVSNQAAHDLMVEGVVPPNTSDPGQNPHYEMIDAQLTTEIFGLFAPGNPEKALEMAYLPIRTTARDNAAWISEFHVYLYSLSAVVDTSLPIDQQIMWMAEEARQVLPDTSYAAAIYDFVKAKFESDIPWEAARDSLYQRYQVEMKDGYYWPEKEPACKGCFAAGINFGAGLVSLFYGQGDFKETVKIGTLCGWDSDNPTATWGGMLGFMMGAEALEELFQQELSDQFNIHRTRGNFQNGQDSFPEMAKRGIYIIDRVTLEELEGGVDLVLNKWFIPGPK